MGNVEQERARRMGEAVVSGLAGAPRGEVVQGGGGGGVTTEKTLRPNQQHALELLVGGMPVEELAEKVGVDRSTVYVWMKKDSAFKAAYNQWVEQVELEAKSRAKVLARKALGAVEKALDGGDGRLGLRMLEKMGIVKEEAAGPTDVEELKKMEELERKRKEVEEKKERAKLRNEELFSEFG